MYYHDHHEMPAVINIEDKPYVNGLILNCLYESEELDSFNDTIASTSSISTARGAPHRTPRLGVSSLDRLTKRRFTAVHHGLIEISDGKGITKRARLELTQDTLSVQVPQGQPHPLMDNGEIDIGLRTVVLERQKDGGLGFSIKGGTDGSCQVPILISKIFKGQAADLSGELFVGDAIVEINGDNVENSSHEEVVSVLRDAGEDVELTVRHNRGMVPFLKGGSVNRNGSIDRLSENSFRAGSTRSGDTSSVASCSRDAPKGWETVVKIPLPMAYVTRYLWGTDKLRPNGFEVRAVDGTSSGVVHCEDPRVMDEWVGYITANIIALNNRTIKMSNKYLHPSDLIVYLGWICERSEKCQQEYWQNWEPKFLILKGSDVCLFDTPPLNSSDLTKCSNSYKVYETSFVIINGSHLMDERPYCAQICTSTQQNHYISMESADALSLLDGAWKRATYYAVQRLGNKSFACNFEGRPSAFTVDFNHGLALFDIHTKHYVWRQRFSQLKSSADDGRMRLQLIFRGPRIKTLLKKKRGEIRSPAVQQTDIVKDIDCLQLYPLLYTIHSFMTGKLLSIDPEFLQNSPSGSNSDNSM